MTISKKYLYLFTTKHDFYLVIEKDHNNSRNKCRVSIRTLPD